MPISPDSPVPLPMDALCWKWLKNPMAMAAAATYLASVKNDEKISQLKISKVSGISAVTIRDRTKEILKKIGGEING